MPSSHRKKEYWRDPAIASPIVIQGEERWQQEDTPPPGKNEKIQRVMGHCSEGLGQLQIPQQFTA